MLARTRATQDSVAVGEAETGGLDGAELVALVDGVDGVADGEPFDEQPAAAQAIAITKTATARDRGEP
jgi:hypothetical protein